MKLLRHAKRITLAFCRNLVLLLIYIYRLTRSKRSSRFVSHPSEKVLIVGNGPSATSIDYLELKRKGISVLCVNYFALKSDLFYQIRPKFYCIIDPALYIDNGAHQKNISDLVAQLNTVDWEMTLISLEGQFLKGLSNPKINYFHLNLNFYEGTWLRYYLFRRNSATFGFQNVVLAALFFCISSQMSAIYLIGVENDWHKEFYVDSENNVFRRTHHFYGVEERNLIEEGEIIKGEFYKEMGYYYVTARQYYLASKYAEYAGVKVRNLTLNSYIDVFQKVCDVL